MTIITDPASIDMAEDFQKLSADEPEQELDSVEQGTFVLISHMFPRDFTFRSSLVAFCALYSGCIVDTALLTKFLKGMKVVAEAIETDPRYLPNVLKRERGDKPNA